MVSETRCDELHRVAASRLLRALFLLTKVQIKSETTKYFCKYFQRKVRKRDGSSQSEASLRAERFLCTLRTNRQNNLAVSEIVRIFADELKTI